MLSPAEREHRSLRADDAPHEGVHEDKQGELPGVLPQTESDWFPHGAMVRVEGELCRASYGQTTPKSRSTLVMSANPTEPSLSASPGPVPGA